MVRHVEEVVSREHSKNLKRGISQPLTSRTLPPRASRHGKPLTHRVRRIVVNPKTNLAEVVVSQEPVGERVLKVAAGPTGTYGKKNIPPKTVKREVAPA